MKLGSAKLGPVKLGPVKLGPVKLGPVKLGPAELGPVKLGPVKLGPAELGPAELGPAELGPVAAVQRAVLDGLAEVARLDAFAGVEIGNGPSDLQDTVVGARGKPEPRDRRFE